MSARRAPNNAENNAPKTRSRVKTEVNWEDRVKKEPPSEEGHATNVKSRNGNEVLKEIKREPVDELEVNDKISSVESNNRAPVNNKLAQTPFELWKLQPRITRAEVGQSHKPVRNVTVAPLQPQIPQKRALDHNGTSHPKLMKVEKAQEQETEPLIHCQITKTAPINLETLKDAVAHANSMANGSSISSGPSNPAPLPRTNVVRPRTYRRLSDILSNGPAPPVILSDVLNTPPPLVANYNIHPIPSNGNQIVPSVPKPSKPMNAGNPYAKKRPGRPRKAIFGTSHIHWKEKKIPAFTIRPAITGIIGGMINASGLGLQPQAPASVGNHNPFSDEAHWRQQFTEAEEEIEKLKQELAEKEHIIMALSETMEEADEKHEKEMKQHNRTVNIYEKMLTDCKATITKKNKEICAKKWREAPFETKPLKEQIRIMQQEVAKAQREKEEAQKATREAQCVIAEQQGQIARQNADIRSYQATENIRKDRIIALIHELEELKEGHPPALP